MESYFLSAVEDNVRVRNWSEKIQMEKGDSIIEEHVSRMSDYTHIHTKLSNLQELKEIWNQWNDSMKQEFRHHYGDIVHLLDVKVEKQLIRALAQHWNAAYSCFTFGEVDLTPTIEEYTALFCCDKFQEDKVYTKIPNDKPFRKKLVALTGATQQWIDRQIQQKGGSPCITWKCLRSLIRSHPVEKKQMTMFALGIYGLVIFPKVLGHIEAAVLDIVDKLDKGITPVPAVLAETFRSLTACRREGEGRFVGCSQLLTVWFQSHFKKIERRPYRTCFTGYSPLEDYLKQTWLEDASEEQWLIIFRDLHEEYIVWRVPWLSHTDILYKCGHYDWVPLPGLWGGTAYAPLMISRQFDSRQFIPATQGLQQANLEYTGDNYREKIHQVAISWNRTFKMKTFSGNPRVTAEYKLWRSRRVNDNIPGISEEASVSMEEYLTAIPTEVEILKHDFEERSNMFGKRIAELEEENFHLDLDADVQRSEIRAIKKGKNKAEEELDLWKDDYRKLMTARRVAGLGKTSEQWRTELQKEKEKTEVWQKKHQEIHRQYEVLQHEFSENRMESVSMKTHIMELETSLRKYRSKGELEKKEKENEMLKLQIEELELSLQNYQGQLDSFEEFQAMERVQWEAQYNDSQRQVQERDHIMDEALVQIREVADHLQTLAVKADVLSLQVELESDRGQKLAELFYEIKKLGVRARRYM